MSFPKEERNKLERGMNTMLEAAIKGAIQVWIILDKKGAERIFHGICITAFWRDPGIQEKGLWIYSIYSYKFMPDYLWSNMVEGLRMYAKSRGCSKLVAYSKIPRVIEQAEKYGFNSDYKILSMEV